MYLVAIADDHGAEPSQGPTIRRVIDQFSTSIMLHILNIDVPRLPFVKLTGSLPVVGMYVRREDIKQMVAIAGELLFSDTIVRI